MTDEEVLEWMTPRQLKLGPDPEPTEDVAQAAEEGN